MNIDAITKLYCPCLRLKMGEYTGLALLAENIKDQILPYFIAPPPKDRDPEHGRQLTTRELFSETAKRISKHWPLRPALLDISYISAALGTMDAHEWLPRLFMLITDLHGNCLPVLNFDSTSSERLGVRNVYERQNNYIGIRIPISYVDDPALFKKIFDIVNVVGCGQERTIVVLDCEDMSLDPVADSYPTVRNAVDTICSFGQWAKVVFVATSYPDRNPAPKNGHYEVSRLEWDLWKLLSQERDFLGRNITFGDYGADCSLIDFSDRKIRRTIPHLRLTSGRSTHVFRGGLDLGETDDGTIRAVARKIVNSPHFETPLKTEAEEFIASCADNSGPPGNPSTWRRVNTIRHITCVTRDLLELKGISLPARELRPRVRQTSFLDDLQ